MKSQMQQPPETGLQNRLGLLQVDMASTNLVATNWLKYPMFTPPSQGTLICKHSYLNIVIKNIQNNYLH